MVRPPRPARKSTGHQPTSQLALQDVTPPQSQESHHDSPQLISQEEEPFEVEIMVLERQEAQDAPAEEHEHQ
jgi:hypothetical protein